MAIMMLTRRLGVGRALMVALGAGALVLGATAARAQQAYPNKPIKLVVPFAPGGTTDIIGRVISAKMPEYLGQPMIVENKAGSGGGIGATETARAAPDGYALGVATVSTTAGVPNTQKNPPYDPLVDFTAITNIAATPNVLAVNPNFPAKDYQGFVKEIKANPEKYGYASAGSGGIANVMMEYYKSLTGLDLIHVPYRGSGPALNDAVSGQVMVIYDNMPSAWPFIKDGRLVPIAVAAPERLSILPNVPTFKELGLEPVNRMAYYGLYGPKGLPREVVDKVNAAVRKAVADPDIRKKIEDTGSIIIANSPEEFMAQINAEYGIYKKVVAERGIKAD